MQLFTKICYILLTQDLSKIFFTAINKEYNKNQIIINKKLQIIYTTDYNVIYQNYGQNNINTNILLLMEQLLFTNNMTIKITNKIFRADSMQYTHIEYDLYKIFDQGYQSLLERDNNIKSNVLKYLVQTIELVKSRNPNVISNVNAFDMNKIADIENAADYDKFFSHADLNHKQYIVYDYVNLITLQYYWIESEKIYYILDARYYSETELKSREQGILYENSKYRGGKKWHEINLDIDNVKIYALE